MKITSTFFTILLFAGLLIISGCGKPANTNPGGTGATGLLKTMIQIVPTTGGTDTTTTNLKYDSQNRVVSQISITSVNGVTQGAPDTTTYTFGTNSVIQYSTGLGVGITYTLNSQGFKQSDNLGNSWVYNSAGYMTQANEVAVGSTTTYAYNNLNQLVTETQVIGSTTNTFAFTYATNPIGKAGSSWNTGQSAGDLFATEVATENGTSNTSTATYTLNGQGQVGESSIARTGGLPTVVTYFLYY